MQAASLGKDYGSAASAAIDKNQSEIMIRNIREHAQRLAGLASDVEALANRVAGPRPQEVGRDKLTAPSGPPSLIGQLHDLAAYLGDSCDRLATALGRAQEIV